MQHLRRGGHAAEALCGSTLDCGRGVELAEWLSARSLRGEVSAAHSLVIDPRGARSEQPIRYRLSSGGLPVMLIAGASTRYHELDHGESEGFLRAYDEALERLDPEVVIGYGGGRLQREVFTRARRQGRITVFDLHNCRYEASEPFEHVDAIRVPSPFAADHYRMRLGLECTALPPIVDPGRIRASRSDPRFVTFVNPTIGKGALVFARLAHELGRRRPDIPFLAVEVCGEERHLASCGLDLREYGNVFLMPHTPTPRRIYSVARIMLVPSLVPETFGLVAAEAMANGIPVLASDRGALADTVGGAGLIESLPERLTPEAAILPEPDEIAHWADAIERLWDDHNLYEHFRELAIERSRLWHPEAVLPSYERFLDGLTRIIH